MTSPNSTENQNERVHERLQQGPATSCELIRDLDIIRPSARIYDLRKDGHNIITSWSWDHVNGGEHRVARYVLLPKEPDPGNAKGPTGTRHTDEAHKAKTSTENSTSIVREAASFSLLAAIVVWALGSAVLGMAGGLDQPQEVVLMTAGVGQHGR